MTFPRSTRASSSLPGEDVQARLLAFVGMPGSGKSLLAEYLEAKGFPKVRFGGITINEVLRRGLEVTPQNEKMVRDEIRANEGMDAYARRSLPFIREALASHRSVIIDGLYSFSEYRTLKQEFGPELVVVSVACDRRLRYGRLAERPVRPLTAQEAEWRDIQEIETLEKGGPIAIADYTILNNDSKEETIAALDEILEDLNITL